MPVELEFDYGQASTTMDCFSQDDINSLKSWTQTLDKAKYVPKDLTDKQLLLFYNACYGDMEKTKACIEKYYNCRKNAPEFFEQRLMGSEELKSAAEVLEFSYLPGKSVEDYDIIFHRLHDTEPSKYVLESGVKLLFMTVGMLAEAAIDGFRTIIRKRCASILESARYPPQHPGSIVQQLGLSNDACLSKRGPQPGYIMLFDMRGVKFGHLTRVSLSALRKFFQYVQEAMPVRMRAIHVLNTEPVMDKLMLLCRPFMDKKFYDMLKFHTKNEDLEKFYETVIPRSSLPPDYGGTLPDTQTLHRKCMQQLTILEPYFKAEEEQRIAALPDKKKEKAMERAFKNLDID